MKATVFFLKKLQQLFVILGLISIVLWTAFGLIYLALGEELFKSLNNSMAWKSVSNPIIILISGFAMIYVVYYAWAND